MKRYLLPILTLGLLACAVNAEDQKTEQPSEPKADLSKIFKSDLEKSSYALGVNTAGGLKSNLKRFEVDFDPEALSRGFKDALSGAPPLITEAQVREILTEVQKASQERMKEKQKQMAEENRLKGEKSKAEGEAFLAKNKTQPGVVALPSGLQYKILTDGSGPTPKAEDEVTVNYRGTLIDGTEFDSSAKHGRPYTTKVASGVIKGWTEALQLMKTGAKWQIFIPPDLAYGANGAGAQIAPNATLLFDLELLSVQAGQPMPPPSAAHSPGAPLTSDIIKVPSAEEIKKGAKIETIKAEDLEKEKAKTKP